MPDLTIIIGKLKLKNPVITASGTFGYAEEFAPFLDIKKLGAITTKTITLKPRQGNPPPRLYETPYGLLNSIGLQNDGYDSFVADKLPKLKKLGIPVIVSIAGESKNDFRQLAQKLSRQNGVDALELNISCPNLQGTRLIAQDPKATYQVVSSVRKAFKKTLITKLSPNVTDILEIARAAERAGADSLSLVNTFFGMSVDVQKRQPHLGNLIGGLSGPAIKPLALAMVYRVAENLKLPIIGMGGIMNTQDALEFMIAGASAVNIGTANFITPGIAEGIVKGMEGYLRKNRIREIKKLVGSIKK